MIPAVAGLALVACFLLGLRGVVLVRDQGPAARILGQPGLVPVEERRANPLVAAYLWLADALAPRMLSLLGPAGVEQVRRRLDAAGRPHGWTIEAYAGKKALFTLLFGVAGALMVVSGRLLPGIVLTVAGWFWMDLALRTEARRRQGSIERDLPDFLDILAVSVSAGLGFRAGMERVAEAMPGPLADEIIVTLRKMDVGATRRAAFEEFRRRNPSESVGQFVTALLQAEELGTPLAQTLNDIAADMRRASGQDARRRAARAAPRISLVVTLVMVPGALVLLAAILFVGSEIDLGVLLG